MIVEELIARLGYRLDGEGNLTRFQSGLMAARTAALAAVGAIAAGGVMLANSVIGVGEQFENLKIRLQSLEGSSEGAERALAWIKDFATKTPLQLQEVTQAYAQLKTFGLDPTNGTLLALVDTMAMNGGKADYLAGITLALGQAWTKQKLQGEEALQLIERGVPVWDLLSESLGVSVEQVQKMASSGKLGRREIQMLIDAMGSRARGASDRFSKSLTGIKSNLEDLKTSFLSKIADAGFFDAFKGRAQALLDTLNRLDKDGTLDAWAQKISDSFVAAMGFMDATINVVTRTAQELAKLDEAMGGWLGEFAFIAAGIAAGIFVLASPWILIIGAISGVIVLLDDLIAWFNGKPALFGEYFDAIAKTWNDFKEKVSGILDGIKAAWDSVIAWFKGVGTSIVDAFKSIDWSAVGKAIVDGILAGLQAAWGGIVSWVDGKIAELEAMFTGFLPDFGGGEVKPSDTGAGMSTWDGLLGGMSEFMSGAGNAADTLAAGGPSSVGQTTIQTTDNSTTTLHAPVNIHVAQTSASPAAIGAAAGAAVKSAGTRAVALSANESGGGGY